MHEQWIAIINPFAGGGRTVREWPAIGQLLAEQSVNCNPVFTQSPQHALDVIREAAGQGNSAFISVGGDGTHHLVVNGLMKCFTDGARPRLAVIPVGTGNDWVRTLGIPRSVKKSVGIIARGRTINHSVGKITCQGPDGPMMRYFINVAGMCLDAEVVRQVSRKSLERFGSLAYTFGGLRGIFTYSPKELVINSSGGDQRGRFITVHAGVGRYSGGGMSFTPHGDPESGLLAVSAITACARAKLLLNLYRAYTGSICRFSHAKCWTAQTLSVSHRGGDPVGIEADGEFLGHSPVEIGVVPRAIEVCVGGRFIL